MGLFSLFSKKSQETGDDLDMPVKPRRSRAATPQAEEPIDPLLPEKQRARRRLIGAVAVVLAAIIGLPMIFDSEPKPLSDDIDIRIPSRDKTAPTASLPMPLPPEPLPAEPKPDAAADQPAAKPQTKAPDVTSATPASISPPAASATKPAPPKLASPNTVGGADAAAAAATDPLADKIAEKARGRFVVQVAAVSSQAKAEELLNRLKMAGIQSYSQKVNTKDGDRFRIRIGPFGSREEADKMRGRLGPLGLSGTVQSV